MTQKGGVSVNLGYSYANGYSAGVSVGFGPNGTGPQVGLDWSDKNGFGASVGYGFSNGVGFDVGVSQRGGTTYSASLSGKGVPVSLNYSLNVNGGKQTNTFGVSIQLPGTEHFSNVRGSLNYSDRLGLSSGVSYNIGKGESPKPMTEAERAQYNLLDDLIGGLGSVVSGIGRGVKSVWDGVFGGDEVDTERALLVREQRFKDYAETYMDDGDAIAGPYGRIKDKQLQEAYGKIHDELYPQKDDGPGAYVMDGFIDPLVKAMKKMLSWSAKTGLDAMDNIKEVSGKIGDVRESLQITKPVVEDTIQLLYKEMDAARTKWRNDDQAIYDQITDLQSGEQDSNATEKIQRLEQKKIDLKVDLQARLNSLDSQVGDLITLANRLNSGEVTNLTGAYAQIYAGLQRVSSPELSAKSQAVINLASSTQAFLVGYFNYKMTGIAATRNETGSAYAFQNYEDQQRQVLRDLWKTVMKQSNMNEKTKYVNSSGF